MSGVIERYHSWIGLPEARAISLSEGSTPLLHWDSWGQSHIFLKLEGLNPTGSFKDRGMTVAVTQALATGAKAVICASTGNTAASAAAYAARARIPALVVVPQGRVTKEKALQAMAHGARFLTIEGNFDDALHAVRQSVQSMDWLSLVNSVNPWRIRGQETGAYEVVDELGRPPQALILPVGNAGNISAYAQGFHRYSGILPKLFGIQAAGASPLVQGHDIPNPETLASAIRIGKPASSASAKAAVAQSHGAFLSVTDEEILAAQKELARGGIFVEPASAAAYAGLLRLRQNNQLSSGNIVVVLTGHGLKDGSTPNHWIDTSTRLISARELGEALWDMIGEAQHVAH